MVYLHHALVDDGVLSCLTDDQISPLYDYDRYEESGVTSVLQSLSLVEGLKEIKKIHN